MFFLAVKMIPEPFAFAGLLGGTFDEIRRAAHLGGALAEARLAYIGDHERRFRWAEKSVAQGERDGFYYLARCYRDGIGCGKDLERAKENFFVSAELGNVYAMVYAGWLFDKDDSRRFVWLGRAAASNLKSSSS
jgi:TPR repeat protein